MKRIIGITLALILLVVGIGWLYYEYISGAGATPTAYIIAAPQEVDSAASRITTIGDITAVTANWDSDPEDDGIEFLLAPRDISDRVVAVDGVVGATLWERVPTDPLGLTSRTGNVINEWAGPLVTAREFSRSGVTVRLPFLSGYRPRGDLEAGALQIRFTVSETNRTFADDTTVILSRT